MAPRQEPNEINNGANWMKSKAFVWRIQSIECDESVGRKTCGM